ncbi:MAG: peptide ABC transporter substrate-binding protein [Anaerolineae bacterium]|nr:peptide ABC transporter substrate-binding protein [Anaerolineae bacterium]
MSSMAHRWGRHVTSAWRWYGVPVVLMGILTVVLACSGHGAFRSLPGAVPSPSVHPLATWTPTPVPPTPKPTATPSRDDVVVGLSLPDRALNPLLLPFDDPAARFLVDALYDRLMPPDPKDGHLTPGVVQAWQVSDDGLTITLSVRDGVRWHDGRPVTAEDVAFTIRSAVDPRLNSLYFVRLPHIRSVEAVGAHTVIVRLDAPSCPTLTGIGDLPLVPAHLLGRDMDAWGTLARSPVGSGPLRFDGWSGTDELTLSATAGSWRGAPHIRKWRVRLLSASDLVSEWGAGALDVAILPPSLTLNPPAGWDVRWAPGMEYVGVFFNLDRLGLSDSRLREALGMALNRVQLNQAALGGRGKPLGAPWLPATWAITPAPTPPVFDQDRAAALLDAAGWHDENGDGWRERDGEPLLVRIKTNGENPVRRDLAMLVAAAYRAVGVSAEVEIIPYYNLIDALFRHDYDIAIFGWPIDLDPDQSLYWRSDQTEPRRGFNLTGWQDECTDALLDQGRTVPACASEARRSVYRALAARLAEQRPVDVLFALPIGIVARAGLQDVSVSSFVGTGTSFLKWHW